MNNGRAIATAMSAFSHDSPPVRAKPTVRDPGEHRLHHGQLHSHGVTQGDDRYHPERRCQKGQCGRNDVAVLGSFSASQCSAALLSTNDLFVPLPNLAVFVFAMEICLSHRQHAAVGLGSAISSRIRLALPSPVHIDRRNPLGGACISRPCGEGSCAVPPC